MPEKEGKIRSVHAMLLNPKGTYIKIMDNNFFANPEWENACGWLYDTKQPIDLQGVDIRSIKERQIIWLNELKHYKQIKIAWDNPKENIIDKLLQVTNVIKPYRFMCYVLISSMLVYYMLRYPLKYIPAGTASAHFSGYFSN